MENLSLFEKKQKSSLIHDGQILKFYIDEVSLPDGKTAKREFCRHRGGVCVIPITDDGCVLCVKQFRYPHNLVTTEIPAGKLDSKTESHKSAALRELKEETGASCGKLTFLGEIYPSPAIMDEIIYIYMAQDLTFGENHLDDDEFLECVKIPIDELLEMICNGLIPDAKTQIATLRAWKILKNL